jgi:hypothetical protein
MPQWNLFVQPIYTDKYKILFWFLIKIKIREYKIEYVAYPNKMYGFSQVY